MHPKRFVRWERFLYHSEWPPILTSWGLGLEMGWAWMYFFHGLAIDGGVATVVTAITALAGSAWMVQFRARVQDQPFEKFVADAAAAIRDEAYVLSEMASLEPWPQPAAEAARLAEQVKRLHRCLMVFQKGSPYAQIRNYSARMRIELLEDEVTQKVELLEKEIAILGAHPTKGVVQVAKEKFKRAIKGIMDNTEEVCVVLGFESVPPSAEQVRERMFGPKPA